MRKTIQNLEQSMILDTKKFFVFQEHQVLTEIRKPSMQGDCYVKGNPSVNVQTTFDEEYKITSVDVI